MRIASLLAVTAAILTTGGSLTASAVAQPSSTTETSADSAWDLPGIYPTPASWAADLAWLNAKLEEAPRLRGLANRSPEGLRNVLEWMHQVRGRAGKMARFAVLQHEVDGSDALAASRYNAATAMEARVESVVEPLDAEIRAIGAAKIREWRRQDPRLDRYRNRLTRIFTLPPRSPAPAAASVAQTLVRWPETLRDSFQDLAFSDMGWRTVTLETGEAVRVDNAAYGGLKRSANARTRNLATEAYLARYAELEPVAGALYTRWLEGEIALADLYGYDGPAQAYLHRADRAPAGALRHAIEASGRQQALARRLRKVTRALTGVEDPALTDFLARPYVYGARIPLAEARRGIIEAMAPFGRDFQAVLAERHAKPWFHLQPAPHKSGTVGIFWQVGGGHPYVLMTYVGDLPSARTLSLTSLGLMTYANYPADSFPDRRSEDGPIFGNAEWYLSGLLYDDYLLAHTAARSDRIALLTIMAQAYVRMLIQYGAIAELQDRAAAAVRSGAPLTGAQLSEAYLEIIRRDFAHGAGGLRIDPMMARYWMGEEPAMLFSSNMAVFAAAAASSAMLAERVRAGDAGTIAFLKNSLGHQESDYSYDLLLAAGVDLDSDAPYQALERRIAWTLDRLEAELAAT